MKKLKQAKQTKQARRAGVFLVFIWLSVFILAGFKMYIANRYVGSGEDVLSWEIEIEGLVGENRQINEKLETESSILVIREKALGLGMRASERAVTIKRDESWLAFNER